MTSNLTDECRVDERTHTELGEALGDSGLDAFAKADMVADALDLTEAEAGVGRPRSSPRRPVETAAAVLLLAFGAYMIVSERGGPPQMDASDATVAAERDANLALLETAGARIVLAKLPKGTFVAIVAGKEIHHDEKLNLLLKRVDAEHPRARHRFVFRAGAQRQPTYRSPDKRVPHIGAAFMNALHLTFAQRAAGDEYTVTSSRGDQTLLLPDRSKQLPLYIGANDSLGTLRIEVTYDTGSSAPLILPPGLGFPRFEIPPGTARVEALDGQATVYQRYLIAVSMPELDVWYEPVEALGTFQGWENEKRAIDLAGHTWPYLHPGPMAAAAKSKRPLLLLTRPAWLQCSPANPFVRVKRASGLLEGYELAWREPEPREIWVGGRGVAPVEVSLQVLHPDGAAGATLALGAAIRAEHVEKFLKKAIQGRPRVDVEGSPAEWRRREGDALRLLRDLIAAQAHLGASGKVDTDRDGVGEFGGFVELTGRGRGRMQKSLRSPLLEPDKKLVYTQDGHLTRAGYHFAIYLPGRGGRPVRERADGFRATDVSADLAETHWCVYAWPDEYHRTGRRTFFTNQSGDIWAVDAAAYSGRAGAPEPDAAFATGGSITGGVSPALASADGNRWKKLD